MNETTFRIRPYSKRELAKLYFPDTLNVDSALSNLRLLMKYNPKLISDLKEAGYRLHAKAFTPKQVGIIIDYLGEP